MVSSNCLFNFDTLGFAIKSAQSDDLPNNDNDLVISLDCKIINASSGTPSIAGLFFILILFK
jgi:hypothetical protein